MRNGSSELNDRLSLTHWCSEFIGVIEAYEYSQGRETLWGSIGKASGKLLARNANLSESEDAGRKCPETSPMMAKECKIGQEDVKTVQVLRFWDHERLHIIS